jgi:hypothetical protein
VILTASWFHCATKFCFAHPPCEYRVVNCDYHCQSVSVYGRKLMFLRAVLHWDGERRSTSGRSSGLEGVIYRLGSMLIVFAFNHLYCLTRKQKDPARVDHENSLCSLPLARICCNSSTCNSLRPTDFAKPALSLPIGLQHHIAKKFSLAEMLPRTLPTTGSQPEIQEPEAVSAPPSQQPMEQKWKRRTSASPTPRPPTKAIRAASLQPPTPTPRPNPVNPTTPPPHNEDTEMQLLLAAEIDPTMIASDSDGFSNLIGKRALRRRCRSLEKEGRVEEKVEATGTGSGHGAASAKGKEESGETV